MGIFLIKIPWLIAIRNSIILYAYVMHLCPTLLKGSEWFLVPWSGGSHQLYFYLKVCSAQSACDDADYGDYTFAYGSSRAQCKSDFVGDYFWVAFGQGEGEDV